MAGACARSTWSTRHPTRTRTRTGTTRPAFVSACSPSSASGRSSCEPSTSTSRSSATRGLAGVEEARTAAREAWSDPVRDTAAFDVPLVSMHDVFDGPDHFEDCYVADRLGTLHFGVVSTGWSLNIGRGAVDSPAPGPHRHARRPPIAYRPAMSTRSSRLRHVALVLVSLVLVVSVAGPAAAEPTSVLIAGDIAMGTADSGEELTAQLDRTA